MSFNKYRYPECMLPDGGPACSQYGAAFARIEQLEDEVARNQADYDELALECRKLTSDNAKLKAVVDAAKKAASQHGIVYPIPSSGEWAMTELKQALEVKGG